MAVISASWRFARAGKNHQYHPTWGADLVNLTNIGRLICAGMLTEV